MSYDHKQIEQKYSQTWKKERVYEPDLQHAKRPYYNLMMFPFLLPLLVFARMQFDESQGRGHLLENDRQLLDTETRASEFLRHFLQPKLRQVRSLLSISAGNSQAAAKQLVLLEDEAERVLQERPPTEQTE